MGDIMMQSILTRNRKITAAAMDEEIVMMNLDTGNYYNLGKTGSIIWNLLEQPISVELLIQQLMDNYRVTRQQCETETLSYLKELRAEGLIEIR